MAAEAEDHSERAAGGRERGTPEGKPSLLQVDVRDDQDDIEPQEQCERTARDSKHPREVETTRRYHGRGLDGTCRVARSGDVLVPPTGSRNSREMLNIPRNARIGIVHSPT